MDQGLIIVVRRCYLPERCFLPYKLVNVLLDFQGKIQKI